MTSLFNIGVGGLKAQQAALSVIGQNITNASTPGYTRQRADMESVVGSVSSLASGAGARVVDIKRVTGAFIDEQVRGDISLFAELDSFASRIEQLESGLFNGEFGVDTALRDFFDAIQNAANEPADLATREFVLDSAKALVNRFQGISERISLQAQDLNTSLESAGVRINEISGLLVEMNERVGLLQDETSSPALNAMLDKREQLLKELAQFVSVKTSEQDDGQMNVFIGKGQPLVLGQEVAHLSISTGGDIVLQPAGSKAKQIVTGAIAGGDLGGLIKYRSDVLDPALNQIGQIAAAFTVAFNQQHALGVDLEGEFGGQVFRDLNDPELVGSRISYLGGRANATASLGAVNVYIEDPYAAEATDYEIYFSENSPGSFEVRRSDSGELVYQGSSIVVPQEISFEGIRVEFASGTINPGDEYLIRPYSAIGSEMDVVLTDAGALALASPVATDADPANSGQAELLVTEVLDPDHPLLSGEQSLLPPLLVEFVSETEYRVLDNSDPSQPRPLQPDLGLLQISPSGVSHILPHELGTSVVSSSGPDIASLQVAAGPVTGLTSEDNGYPAGSFTVDYAAQGTPDRTVSITANASARQIAAELSATPGIRASARTELTLSDLVVHDSGTPVEIVINGEVFTDFATMAELADLVSANEALQASGIQALSDGTTLSLAATHGDDLSVHFQGDPNESVALLSNKGEQAVLRGSVAGNYSTATIGGELSVLVEPDATVSTNFAGMFAAQPVHARADLGFDGVLRGDVNAGDRFSLEFNSGGVGDNRNAVHLAGLGEQQLIGDPPRSFYGVFANLVQSVGVEAGQVNINKQAASVLLAQSESFRESISGVNLDEEAALLIRHEQAYNAAAQIISVARDVFNVLLNSVS